MTGKVSVGKAKAVRETDKALLVAVEDLGEEIWVPKSQIHDDSEVYADGHEGDLVVSAWYAASKGWT